MTKKLITIALFGLFLGAYIGKASGEELSIKNLEVGDRIPKQTLWYFAPAMANKLKKGQEAEIISISDDKTQMRLEVVDIVDIELIKDEEITQQEYWNRSLKALEK